MKRYLQNLKIRLQQLYDAYGTIAILTHLTVFALVLTGFWVAIEHGFRPEGMAAGTGTVVAAYAATKVLSPVRIGITLVSTPLIARLLRRAPAVAVPVAAEAEGAEPS